MKENIDIATPWLLHSCYYNFKRESEQFVEDHAFCQVQSGSLEFYVSGKKILMNEGDTFLFRKNQLAKTTKYPGKNGVMMSTTVRLDQQTLRKFSKENNITADRSYTGENVIMLKPNKLYKSYVDSLAPYIENPASGSTKKIVALKVSELIFLLLEQHKGLKDLLFDFNEPGKIDLEEYMNKHFDFNVEMKRFAYLTGRSLATFKRDFEKIFHNSPSRWLQQRRLEEAHYQIKEKGRAPSDVYLDLGFENLSHFSFAFKKTYGVPPSKL